MKDRFKSNLLLRALAVAFFQFLAVATANAQSGDVQYDTPYPPSTSGAWSMGPFGKPVPATNGQGKGIPGCFIVFGQPNFPDDELPDPPCALMCIGGNPGTPPSMKQGPFRAACRQMGDSPEIRNKFADLEPDFPNEGVVGPDGRVLDDDEVPPLGSATCSFMVGPTGVPNWAAHFPKGHPMCGGVSGEPHVTTFDDARYDLQAAGDFIAVEAADDDLMVQLRLEPVAGLGDVSVVTQAAARVEGHRVTVAAGRDPAVRVDGVPVELEHTYFMRIAKTGGAVVRTENRYSVVWRDGTNMHVDVFRGHLNVHVLAAEGRDGRLSGLLGDAGGDGGTNDFRTREGTAIAAPPAFSELYSVFAESWRVGANESLFDADGAATPEGFPSAEMTIDMLEPELVAASETSCREAGVSSPGILEDCTFDLAVTGDEDYITSALSREPPPEYLDRAAQVPAAGPATISLGDMTLVLPREVITSFPIAVSIKGGRSPRDTVAIARAGMPDQDHLTQIAIGDGPGERTVVLIAHNEAGAYEFRYKTIESRWREALARVPFVARDPVASLEAADTASTGGALDVRCIGECSPRAYITVVPVGAPDHALGPRAELARGPEVTILNLPAEPGAYEVRYLAPANPRRVFAQRPITLE